LPNKNYIQTKPLQDVRNHQENRKETVSSETVSNHHRLYASRTSLNSKSTQNLTHIENQRPVRPRKAKNGHSSSYSHPIVIRRDKNGRPERPLSEKPTLSEKAWRYSSQLSIRCSMPGLHHSQSSFNRESAVDVDFEKAEEERWKRHSYAANETQQSSDDVFDNPRPKSTFYDSRIVENTLQHIASSREMEESSRSSPDSPDSSHPVSPDVSGEISTDSEKEEVRTITASNRSSVDSVLPQSGSESLNRRKSRSISNFQRDNLDHANGPKFATVRRSGELSVSSISSTMTITDHQSRKPSRRTSDFHFNENSISELEDSLEEAEAVWDYSSWDCQEELTFKAGDVIKIIEKCNDAWWWGACKNQIGWFPASFIRLKQHQNNPKLSSVGLKERVRSNVVKEILDTERTYVRHLRDIINGYIITMEEKGSLFTTEDVAVIFGNLREIHTFQEQFLEQLEIAFRHGNKIRKVAETFQKNAKQFQIYSDYCNNHPDAVNRLKELCGESISETESDQSQGAKYKRFLEMCRLKQNMSEIDLGGFLLQPIQRICRYPLQLKELKKTFDTDHELFSLIRFGSYSRSYSLPVHFRSCSGPLF